MVDDVAGSNGQGTQSPMDQGLDEEDLTICFLVYYLCSILLHRLD